MKRLFICEKPSLAEAVAGFLGNPNKKDGYFQAGNDYVVWLQGHILAQKMPEDYDPDLKKYTYASLPIIPKHWEKFVKPNGNYPKIYKTVTQLLKEVDYEHHPIRLLGLAVSNPREESQNASDQPEWIQLELEFKD